MKTHAIKHGLDQHEIKHPFGEIQFWTWVAAAVVAILLLASFFDASESPRVGTDSIPTERNAAPPFGYPASLDH